MNIFHFLIPRIKHTTTKSWFAKNKKIIMASAINLWKTAFSPHKISINWLIENNDRRQVATFKGVIHLTNATIFHNAGNSLLVFFVPFVFFTCFIYQITTRTMTPDQLKLHSFVFVSHPKRNEQKITLELFPHSTYRYKHTMGTRYACVFRIDPLKLMHSDSFFFLLVLSTFCSASLPSGV